MTWRDKIEEILAKEAKDKDEMTAVLIKNMFEQQERIYKLETRVRELEKRWM